MSSQKDRIWHIIPHMRRMFLKIEYSDPEHEAAKLHKEDIIQFRNKVRECVDFRCYNWIIWMIPYTNILVFKLLMKLQKQMIKTKSILLNWTTTSFELSEIKCLERKIIV